MRFALLLLAALGASGQDAATLIIRNARVWTGNPAQPWAEAVAVRGERIAAVGSNAAAAKFAGPGTDAVDAGGRLLIPGFNDAHIHFLGGSQRLEEVDLTGACTLKEMQARIRDWALSHPGAAWVTGGGWEYNCFPGGRLPRKEDLDEAVRDKPAFLRAYDGHTAWANSRALALAGVTAETKYGGFGELVRDPSTGEPAGSLKEGAMSLVSRLIPPATREQRMAALRKGLKLAASLGITSIQNASGSREEIDLYDELRREGALTMRVSIAMPVGPNSPGCKALGDLKGKFTGPQLRVAAVKFLVDGVIESHTAAMLEPYSDGVRTTGQLSWPEAGYRRAVAECDAEGWQIYTHAIGDRGVRLALDAYEEARRLNGPRDSRHRVEHIEVIHPDDIPRFARLGVMASMEPIHADPDTIAVWSKAVGPARLPWSFPWASLEKAGAKLVFSSDWPAAISVDPIRGLHNAVNRQTVDGRPPGGWLPHQRVSLESALRAYTQAGAFSSFEEKEKGTIEAGKYADLVLLSQDLFRIPPSQIHRARVDLTILGGTVVFRR
jgi:predicted amidohydrolase YtcJ